MPVRARLSLPGNLGTPLHQCARLCSCQCGSVRPQNLALRLLTSMHVPVRAGLGLYAGKTWLCHPWQVCACWFVPVGVRTAVKSGGTSQAVGARVRSCPLGLFTGITRLHAPGRVCTHSSVPVWACTPRKLSCTPLHEYARARSFRFGLVRQKKTWFYAP